jgi:hypothetical protein
LQVGALSQNTDDMALVVLAIGAAGAAVFILTTTKTLGLLLSEARYGFAATLQ